MDLAGQISKIISHNLLFGNLGAYLMDYLVAICFLVWYEALTLPLRTALLRIEPLASRPGVRRLLSRVAGPALLLWPLWLLGHWIAPLTGAGVGWLWWLVGTTVGVGLVWRRPSSLDSDRRIGVADLLGYAETGSGGLSRRDLLLDLGLLALFMGLVSLRRLVPEMTWVPGSGEKFTNMMLFWATWHAPAMPPQDYWLAGKPLVYYYWGHFHWAWIGRMAGFPGEIAINLSQARLALLLVEAGWLVGRSLGLGHTWAAIGAVAAMFGGNPQAIIQAWRQWQGASGIWRWGDYMFWGPSRTLGEEVISEFPAFTIILGDFHAHQLALPWLLGWWALLLAGGRWGAPRFFQASATPPIAASPVGTALWICLFLVLPIVATVANIWHLPLIAATAGVWGLIVLSRRWRRPVATGAMLILVLGALVLLLKLSISLIRSGEAIPLTAGATDGSWLAGIPIEKLPTEVRSDFGRLLALWGFPVGVLGIALLSRLIRSCRNFSDLKRERPAWIAGGLGLLTIVMIPILPGGVAWMWVGVGFWISGLLGPPDPRINTRTALALWGSVAVLAGLELAYLPDGFTGAYVRYNTYFKFSFPIWPVLTIGAAAGAQSLWRWHGRCATRWSLRLLLLFVAGALSVYTILAIPARIIQTRRPAAPEQALTLDATEFINHYPGHEAEASVLGWIRRNVPPGEVVAEAATPGAYHYQGRVASLAGRPVPIGWAHHEGQWRGRGNPVIGERIEAVDRLYREADPARMRQRARELGVQWVMYGEVEQERYGRGGSSPLGRLRQATPIAFAWPPDQPRVYLFDFREEAVGLNQVD